MFSQTYILYDKAGVVKPTSVSELEQYVNIFSQFTVFCEKSNKNPKNFMKNKKNFSLTLRKLDGSPANFFRKKFQ